jgi:2OG-Fe(II) oxygenase superfamily
MSTVQPMSLQGNIPVLRRGAIKEDARNSLEQFREQLRLWGFLAMEMPGIGASTKALYDTFKEALESRSPRLADYSADVTPQTPSGGNHGFFGYESEVPRLAQGVPDPKEFLHVSGAMLEDRPAGAARVLRAFPELAMQSESIFSIGFSIAQVMGDVVRDLLPGSPPELSLSPDSSILRVIRYRDSGDRNVLAHEHSGIQMLGVQFPPSDGGLQYVLNDGTWVEPVVRDTDILLCNIGRMLSLASGGRFRPSTHRVHRSALNQSPERWSAVVFVHPDHAAQQWRIGLKGDVQLQDVTWGHFVNRGLRELSLTD